MIIFKLACEYGHTFEGWFASTDEYDSQHRTSLVSCPLCESRRVERRPTAPRLNSLPMGDSTQPVAATAAIGPAHWMQAIAELLSETEDVGDRFAEEARRIHHGKSLGRSIRGVTTTAEAEALRDEGIEILNLPIPHRLKEPLQ